MLRSLNDSQSHQQKVTLLFVSGLILMSVISCGAGEAEGEPELAPPPGKSLEMENARLRAEIATQYAMEAARSLAGEGTPRETALPLSASQRSLQGRSGQLGSEVCHCFGRSPQSHCFWQWGFLCSGQLGSRGVSASMFEWCPSLETVSCCAAAVRASDTVLGVSGKACFPEPVWGLLCSKVEVQQSLPVVSGKAFSPEPVFSRRWGSLCSEVEVQQNLPMGQELCACSASHCQLVCKLGWVFRLEPLAHQPLAAGNMHRNISAQRSRRLMILVERLHMSKLAWCPLPICSHEAFN